MNNIINFKKHKQNLIIKDKSRNFHISESIIRNIIDDLDRMGYDVYNSQDMIDDFLAMEIMLKSILDKRCGIENPVIKFVDMAASEYIESDDV
jgi:hypothetical protein